MDAFSSLKISATALEAQKVRMNVYASNIANANSTRTPEGTGAYRRKDVLFSTFMVDGGYGVDVKGIVDDTRPMRQVFEPGHPDADPQGYVTYPNVNVIEEMVNMVTATRAYEASITAMNNTRAMAQKALELGR